jgi:hypothetical protein
MMASMPETFASLTWTPEQVRAERLRGLRELIAHARAHSPWHRKRLADVDPERCTEDDLRRLPVMTKHDLMSHFDAIVTDPRLTRAVVERHLDALTRDAYLLDEYHVCASGGSSGQRGVFLYERDACFTYGDGPTVHPFTFRSILGREAAIVEYQVRQTPRGADVRVRGDGAIDTARIAAKLRDALVTHGVAEAQVTVTVVPALERQPTGKLRRFLPL